MGIFSEITSLQIIWKNQSQKKINEILCGLNIIYAHLLSLMNIKV